MPENTARAKRLANYPPRGGTRPDGSTRREGILKGGAASSGNEIQRPPLSCILSFFLGGTRKNPPEARKILASTKAVQPHTLSSRRGLASEAVSLYVHPGGCHTSATALVRNDARGTSPQGNLPRQIGFEQLCDAILVQALAKAPHELGIGGLGGHVLSLDDPQL